ncbi:MAG TPA: helix-turn-helix domain-containing protein [Phenylobacterium sp.]|uniref:helix-turn-helix domain-containing protein n=1 Tax=Phenylobacterium sp. TaxID=1871053 RepID=UPI002B4A5200|nr:helix-turn-helix domain-containing protein [Phenylobacterium sp.]HKR89133.1 helix-turn-helix domain-containing protein [Phenylobacterium sp.]
MTLACDTDTHATPDDVADVMRRLGALTRFNKDQEIFAQDDRVEFLRLVVSGAVRTTRLLGDGRRQVGAFYFPGELLLETGPIHRFSAEALCDTTLLAVRRSTIQALAGEARLDRAIWEAIRRELERTQDHVLTLGRKTACERVASFLMSLAQRDGAGRRVAMPMTRQDVADYLGLTIETVSRMLTQLQSASVVEFDGYRNFTVTRWDALEDLAA